MHFGRETEGHHHAEFTSYAIIIWEYICRERKVPLLVVPLSFFCVYMKSKHESSFLGKDWCTRRRRLEDYLSACLWTARQTKLDGKESFLWSVQLNLLFYPRRQEEEKQATSIKPIYCCCTHSHIVRLKQANEYVLLRPRKARRRNKQPPPVPTNS